MHRDTGEDEWEDGDEFNMFKFDRIWREMEG